MQPPPYFLLGIALVADVLRPGPERRVEAVLEQELRTRPVLRGELEAELLANELALLGRQPELLLLDIVLSTI